MNTIIPLKQFRENVAKYAAQVAQGRGFIITKKSQPLFRIEPVDQGAWEAVIDFTAIKPGGIALGDLLKRL